MKKSTTILLASFAMSCFAGLAHAQPLSVYASGIAHDPVGSAQLGPVNGRRLPVRNLGSSGQDGVEIKLQSMFGGGVEIDTNPFSSTAGAEIKIRHKGWDGVIYGNHRCVSNGDNTTIDTYDYSPMGATSITITDFDEHGNQISSTTYPGPVVTLPGNQRPINCPCGWVTVYFWAWVNGKYHWCSRNYCPCLGGGTSTPIDDTNRSDLRMVTPNFPVGVPEMPGVDTLLVSASGLHEFDITATDLGSFGTTTHGLGQARVTEECFNPGGCNPEDRRLPIRNLGSSGQDGVEIKWPRASRVSYQCDGPTSNPGGPPAVMVMKVDHTKPTWNIKKGTACRMETGGSSPFTAISFDTADFGNAPIRIRTFVDGNPTGGGTGDPQGIIINVYDLDWAAAHPFYSWFNMDLRVRNLRSLTGEPITVFLLNNGMFTVHQADEITMEVLTTDLPEACTGMTIRASGTAGDEFSIGDISFDPVAPRCVADVDDGSGTGTPDGGVTIEDLLHYLAIFDQGSIEADVDDGSATGTRDGGVTIDDLLYMLIRFEAGC